MKFRCSNVDSQNQYITLRLKNSRVMCSFFFYYEIYCIFWLVIKLTWRKKQLQLSKAIHEALFFISELIKNVVDQCSLNNIYNSDAFDMVLLDLVCCIRILELVMEEIIIRIIKANPFSLSVLIAHFRLCSTFFTEAFHTQGAGEHFSSWHHVSHFYDFDQVL